MKLFLNRWRRVNGVMASRFIQLRAAVVTLVFAVTLAFLGGVAIVPEDPDFAKWDDAITEQRELVARARAEADQQVDALAARVGELNARLVRLDALGQRLTEVAKLDPEEFNFDGPPALGGPENPMSDLSVTTVPALDDLLGALQATLDDRARQLAALEALVLSREVRRQGKPGGSPVAVGYMSSTFGYRTDPITGKPAFHGGVDFAGPENTVIVAVADGMVTKVARSSTYGMYLEIRHHDGYVSRYAHNNSLLVQQGDEVNRGEPIALMGSTGRSTGTHLHFEVVKDGNLVNPLAFIRR